MTKDLLRDITKGITRVEVIDDKGRVYSTWNAKNVELHLQDDDRTLKVFIDCNFGKKK